MDPTPRPHPNPGDPLREPSSGAPSPDAAPPIITLKLTLPPRSWPQLFSDLLGVLTPEKRSVLTIGHTLVGGFRATGEFEVDRLWQAERAPDIAEPLIALKPIDRTAWCCWAVPSTALPHGLPRGMTLAGRVRTEDMGLVSFGRPESLGKGFQPLRLSDLPDDFVRRSEKGDAWIFTVPNRHSLLLDGRPLPIPLKRPDTVSSQLSMDAKQNGETLIRLLQEQRETWPTALFGRNPDKAFLPHEAPAVAPLHLTPHPRLGERTTYIGRLHCAFVLGDRCIHLIPNERCRNRTYYALPGKEGKAAVGTVTLPPGSAVGSYYAGLPFTVFQIPEKLPAATPGGLWR